MKLSDYRFQLYRAYHRDKLEVSSGKANGRHHSCSLSAVSSTRRAEILFIMLNKIGLIGLFIIACAMQNIAFGEAWQLKPELSVGQRFNSNYRLTPDSSPIPEQEVYTTRVAGALGVSRLTDTMELEAVARLDFIKFFGDDEGLDDTHNQALALKAINKRERTNLGLKFLLRHDTILRSVDVFEDPIDGRIEEDESVDEGVVPVNVRRIRIRVGPELDYKLTETTNLGFDYRYDTNIYDDNDDPITGDTILDEFDKHTIRGSVNTQVTEKDRLILSVLGSRFDSDSGNTTDNAEIQVGLSHDFDETTNVGVTLGGRFTDQDTPTQSGSDTGFVTRLSARKEAGLTRFDVRLERRLSPSGIGEEVETDEFNVRVARKLSDLILFSLRARGFENESIETERSTANKRRLRLEPRLSWKLTPSWIVETSYVYTRQKRFENPDSGEDHSGFISLTYRWPYELPDFF